MPAAVGADDVEKSYGDVHALRGVSLDVDAGEVYALVGTNGAGKTTLVRCLTGTTRPDAGGVALFGDPPASAAKERVGLLPQDYAPPDRLTPQELVSYYAGLYDDASDPDAVLSAVGIDAERDTYYADLSGGEKRRTSVAAALVNDPDVLFLDEPTTGIDPAGRRVLWQVIEDLVDTGTTVFLTTHDMAEAERLADRVGLLADGRLVAEGTPEDLISAHGGPTRLHVDTAATVSDVEDSDWEVLATDDGLVFQSVAPEEVGSVVDHLDASGVQFERLTWREPTLEDAYLALADGTESDDLATDTESGHVHPAGGDGR